MSRLKRMKKKGVVGNIESYFYAFVAIVVAAFVFFILADALQTTQDTNSTAYNATGNMITAMYNATSQLPTAGTLIGIGVILAVVGAAIYGYKRMNGGF